MSRRVRLALFFLGLLGCAALVWHIGPARLLADARQTGWLFVPIVAAYAVVYLCNAASWHLLFAGSPNRPPFLRTLAITVSGFSLNAVTPFVPAGGEAFRVAAFAPWVGSRRAASVSVSFFLVHSLGSLVVWVMGLLGLLVVVRPEWRVGVATAIVGAGLSWLIWVLVGGHREGVLERAIRVAERLPLPSRAFAALGRWRTGAMAIDAEVAEFYRRDRRRFVGAVGLDVIARTIGFFEYWLACRSVGIPLSYERAFLVGSLAALGTNLLFFIPFELGWKEGVLFSLFRALGFDASAGVYVSMVTRVREVAWVMLGLGLMGVAGRRRESIGVDRVAEHRLRA